MTSISHFNTTYMKKMTFASLVILATVFTACKKDYYETTPAPDLTVPVSFSADIMPIFVSDCFGSGCHDDGQVPDLTAGNAYNALKNGNYLDSTNATSSGLYTWLVDTQNPMPPAGKMSNDKINKILAWLKQGYKNN